MHANANFIGKVGKTRDNGPVGLPLNPSTELRGRRLVFIDGLRGLAALAVFMEHAVRVMGRMLNSDFSAGLLMVGRWGHLGVDVFFVLSGFVISLTLSNARITPRYFLRFLGRRALRLDPPYWAAIALTCGVAALQTLRLTRLAPGPGSPGQVVAHLFYLQRLLGYPQLNIVFWTLAIEVQFYLGMSAFLGVLQWGKTAAEARRRWALGCGVLFAASLLWTLQILPKAPFAATLLPYLGEFLAGALVWWVSAKAVPARPVRLALAGMGCIAAFTGEFEMTAAAVTALLLDFSRVRGGMASWLGGRPWQFLGRISYSLYLTHVPVSVLLVGRLARFLRPGHLLPNTVWVLAMLGASLGAATLFYFAVEAPSLRLHHRLKLTPPREEVSVVALVPAQSP